MARRWRGSRQSIRMMSTVSMSSSGSSSSARTIRVGWYVCCDRLASVTTGCSPLLSRGASTRTTCSPRSTAQCGKGDGQPIDAAHSRSASERSVEPMRVRSTGAITRRASCSPRQVSVAARWSSGESSESMLVSSSGRRSSNVESGSRGSGAVHRPRAAAVAVLRLRALLLLRATSEMPTHRSATIGDMEANMAAREQSPAL
eukprot:3990221-Prymnesium_polylepis.1